MKRCSKCGGDKPTTDYSPSELRRRSSRCKSCVAERGRAWYANNRERALEYSKRNRKPYGPAKMAYYRKRRYGMTQEHYARLMKEQAGCCAICSQEFAATPHVDHCHDTRRVRGLLCGPCNRALGLFKDSPRLLRAAQEYLTR